MKFIGIWILSPLKTSGGQLVALEDFSVWLGGYFSAWVLIDTIIHPCFNGESCSKGLCIWTLKSEQQNAIDHVCAFGEFDHSFCRWFWL